MHSLSLRNRSLNLTIHDLSLANDILPMAEAPLVWQKERSTALLLKLALQYIVNSKSVVIVQ